MEQVERSEQTSASGTVLIVDDEPQLLRLLGRVFERAGFCVLSAADGDSAVTLLGEQSGAIDILLLDVVIPPQGARSVLEALPEAKRAPELVLASGDSLEPELEALLEERNGVFLRKPFSPTQSLETVRKMLERRHAAALA